MTLAILPAEFAARRDGLAERIGDLELAGAVLFDPHHVLYYTGFAFIPTERPIAFALAADGRGGMLVPRLEVEHAQANAAVQEVASYDEYPGERHPLEALPALLDALGARGRLGADEDGYPWILGYRGPTLGELTGAVPERIAALVEDQMAVKSSAEIALLRESSKWANLAHTLLQRYTRPGLTETEVAQRASAEATSAMLDAIGPIYRAQSLWYDGAAAGYRGQIGRNAAIPHALANNIVFAVGDVLVTGATAPVWGYHSELERTMVIGPPSGDQKRLFDHMLALQDLAFDAIRPGARAFRARCGWKRTRCARAAAPISPSPRSSSTTTAACSGPRRRDGDTAGHGLHRRAGAVLGGARRLPPFRHRRGHGGWARLPHVLSARPREPDPADIGPRKRAATAALF